MIVSLMGWVAHQQSVKVCQCSINSSHTNLKCPSENTRYSKINKLYVPKQNLCVSRRALIYNGCIEFNKLPSDIQDCKTLASFKCKAFKYIMQSV